MGSKIPSCVFWMNVGLNSKKCRELHSLSPFHTITKRSILSKPSITQIINHRTLGSQQKYGQYIWETQKKADDYHELIILDRLPLMTSSLRGKFITNR